MPNRRSILSRAERDALFAISADPAELSRIYAFDTDDLALIRTRRTPGNQLGLALHLGLLRAPGFGWRDTEQIPDALISWIAELIQSRCYTSSLWDGQRAADHVVPSGLVPGCAFGFA